MQQVAGIWSALKRSAPRDAARLERLLTRRQRAELNSLVGPLDALPPFPDSGDGVGPPPVDETDAETEERGFIFDLRYNSQYTCHFNRAEDAEKFVALKNPEKYPDLIEYFGADIALAYAKTGNIEKLRPFLARETDRLVKLGLLSHAAAALAKKGDKQAAEKLLGEAALLVPQNLTRRDEFGAVETYALARAGVEPQKGFDTVERLLDRANQLLGLRAELAEFSRPAANDHENFLFAIRRRQIADNSAHSVAIIRALSHTDFDRTVKLAERFSEPGQRLFFRWYIINALLNRHAEEEQQRYVSVDLFKLCG